MTEMKRCECQGGFDVEIIAPDGTPIAFPTRAEMQAALIAQYDAIVAAVETQQKIRCGYICECAEDEYNEAVREIIDAIAKHDPRKGAE